MYFVTKIVLTYCEKKIVLVKFEAEGREFSKILRSLEQFIQTLTNFWLLNVFLTRSWRLLRGNRLEQLEFKLEKKLGLRNMQEKFEKTCMLNEDLYEFQSHVKRTLICLKYVLLE